jgi:hypothetical protein
LTELEIVLRLFQVLDLAIRLVVHLRRRRGTAAD